MNGCHLLALDYTEPSLLDDGERLVVSVFDPSGAKVHELVLDRDQVLSLLRPLLDEASRLAPAS